MATLPDQGLLYTDRADITANVLYEAKRSAATTSSIASHRYGWPLSCPRRPATT